MVTKNISNNLPVTIPLGSTKNEVTRLLERGCIVAIDLQLTAEEDRARQLFDINQEGVLGNFLFWGSIYNEDLCRILNSTLAP